MPDPRPSPARFAAVPARELAMLLAGVFFTFAPAGLLFQLVPANPGNIATAALSTVIAGAFSACWAATFILRRLWWIAILVPLQFLVPFFLFPALARVGIVGGVRDGATAHRIAYAVIAVACIVVGYVVMIRFVRGLERRTERYKAELDLASQIHESLVPPIDLTAAGVHVFGRSSASQEMGGDLIDAAVREGELDVFLADVSGHGVKAGVVMGMAKSAIRTRLLAGGELASVVRDLNTVLCDLTTPEMFVTMACVRFTGPGVATAALAGHLPILHFRAADGAVSDIPNDHVPLGILSDEPFASVRVPLAPGDTLVLLTDGLTETFGPDGAELGMEPIRAVIRQAGRLPLPALYDAIISAVTAHGPATDDRTLLLIRVI